MDDNIEAQVDPQAGEQHVKEMWKCLGIGENGYLTVSELGTVCRHIGMEEMQDWEVHQLFDQLDADGDGQVTFDEFLNEMFQYSTPSFSESVGIPQVQVQTHLPTQMSQPPSTQVSRTKSRRRRSFIRKTGMPQYESFFLSQEETTLSFTTLDVCNKGCIKGEDLVELWESYGISNAMDILNAYGFEPDREVSHAKLASVLEDELLFTADHTPKLQAAIITCLQECKNLRCLLEQASAERDRLIIGLRESNIRSQILAEEDDERHAALEKTLQTKVHSMEGIYQEQIKSLKEDLKKEREERMDVMDEHDMMIEKMTTSYREESKRLKEDLSSMQEDLRQTQAELNEFRERVKDLERQKHKLQYQLSVERLKSGGKSISEQWDLYQATSDSHNMMRQQIAQLQDENKHLGDRLEELNPQCRRINHRTTDRRRNLSRSMSLREQSLGEVFPGSTLDILHRSSGSTVDRDEFNQMQRELKQLKKNMEIEHKEIEHAYLIEIAQIEERHHYEMSEALKQAKREKEKILEDRSKRQQEALSKLEKELQNQFALEKQDLLLKHETEKNLLEQKLAEDKIRLTERLRFEYLDDLHRKTREMEKSISGECPSWQLPSALPGSQHTAHEGPSLETARQTVSPPPAPDNVPSHTVTNSGDDDPSNNNDNTGAQSSIVHNPVSTTQSVGCQHAHQSRDRHAGQPHPSHSSQFRRSFDGSIDHCRFGYQSTPNPNRILQTEMMASLPDIYEEIALVSSPHAPTSASAVYQGAGQTDVGRTGVAAEATDGECDAVDGGSSEEKSDVATSLADADQSDRKKLVIQLCCMEELHKVDESKLQSLFGKSLDREVRGEFVKALTKYRDEEILRMNLTEKDNNSSSDASDNSNRPRLPPPSPTSSSSTSSSSISESHKPRRSRSLRFKSLDGDGEKLPLLQRYEEKLKSQEREILRLKRRSVDQTEPCPPKEYSVKSAVTNLGYQLLFPRQKQSKATQTENRRHLHRNMSDLHLKYFYQEEKLQNLEKELTQRDEQTHNVMKNVEDTYRNVIHEIEEEREQLKNKLISATEALHDQSGKLQEQQSKSMNRDLLLKDLYLQNAELMRSLQQLEEQLRTADQKNLQLEEKCRVLDKVLQKDSDGGSIEKIFSVFSSRRGNGTIQDVAGDGKCSKDDYPKDKGSVSKSNKDASESEGCSVITVISLISSRNSLGQGPSRGKTSSVFPEKEEQGGETCYPFGSDNSVKNPVKLHAKIKIPACFLRDDNGEEAAAFNSRPNIKRTERGKCQDIDRSDSDNKMSGNSQINDSEDAIYADGSCSDDIDDASFVENLDDSNATDLGDFEFTDEEEDPFLEIEKSDRTASWKSARDVAEFVSETQMSPKNESETEDDSEEDFGKNTTENQIEFVSQTTDGINKDGVVLNDDSKHGGSESGDNEADDVRLEFLSELEEKYTQVRQLVTLVKDEEIRRKLIGIVRWILQTHQRLEY